MVKTLEDFDNNITSIRKAQHLKILKPPAVSNLPESAGKDGGLSQTSQRRNWGLPTAESDNLRKPIASDHQDPLITSYLDLIWGEGQ